MLARATFENRQPIVQKRTKYKTVEQAKSRYSLGVSLLPRELQFIPADLLHGSPSLGKLVYYLS